MNRASAHLLPEVWVLRLGHRPFRDKRVTTHLALAARALGARGMFIEGDPDRNVADSVSRIVANWGGDFQIKFVSSAEKTIDAWKGKGLMIHLTMYGLPFEKFIEPIRRRGERVLVVVGGKKVPGSVYSLADFNLAVTGQPHSEVSALALFLDRLYEGKEITSHYHRRPGTVVVPSPAGKSVLVKSRAQRKQRARRSMS